MLTIRFFILAIFLTVVADLRAQSYEPVLQTGYFVDDDRQPINGFIDFTYMPKQTKNYGVTLGEDYTTGHYYDRGGNKIIGRLKYSQYGTSFRFSTNNGKDSEKIEAGACNGYVIGGDSFAVVKDFNIERELVSVACHDREFAEVLTCIEDLVFYKHIKAGTNNVVETVLVRKGMYGELESFSKSIEKFCPTALKYFGHIPYLKQKLEKRVMSHEDIYVLIKYLDYYTKLERKEKMYYTSSWDETRDTARSAYYAEVLAVEKSKWKIKYFTKQGTPLYEGQFSSLLAMEKSGLFTFYFPNGATRKKIVFLGNAVKDSILEFYPSAILKYEYTQKGDHKKTFRHVYDSTGTELLNASGNGTEILFDAHMKRTVTRIYKSNKLSAAYYVSDDGGGKVYQLCTKSGTSTRSEEYVPEARIKYPTASIVQNSHGLVIVRILVDAKGNTTATSIIKGVDSSIDQEVLQYCKTLYSGKAWIPVKVDEIFVAQEALVSFEFTLSGFSRYRNHNTNMFMQQQQMQRMTTPTIPASFR